MMKLLATILAVSSLAVNGCAANTADDSVINTKLPLVMHDKDNALLLIGVYDDGAHTVRVSSEFLQYVESKSAGAPELVVSDESYPLGEANLSTENDDILVGDTVELVAPDAQGKLLHWKLEVATPGTEAETATQTQFDIRCVLN